MKNSNLFINLSCMIPALLILCIVNLKAQNELNGYTYLGQRYDQYNDLHYYYISNCETTWEEANEAAIEMGGYLATLSDYWESIFLQYALENHGVGYPDPNWIGLRGVNGVYEWANGETDMWEFPWAFYPVQEPVSADGAALMQDSLGWGAPDWKWSTSPISGEFKYIVEFPFQPNCNNNPNKTYVCHNGNTICVNVSAVQSHLDHGDLEGPCGPCNSYSMQALPDEILVTEDHTLEVGKVAHSESKEDLKLVQKISPSNQIHIFPNPASEEINVMLPKVNQEGTLRILSLTGQEIYTLHLQGQQSISFDLSTYAAGIYLMDVRSSNGHYQKKFVKL